MPGIGIHVGCVKSTGWGRLSALQYVSLYACVYVCIYVFGLS